jgi:disease resistance protein RPM1
MEGAIQSLATNVAQLLSEEYKRLRGVGGEIAELRDDMATMNALIHMQSQADDRAVDSFTREWMKQLGEAAFDADNCIDKYMYRVRSRPNDGVRTWAWLKHQVMTLFERDRLSREIAALRARTTTICERHARYGINLEALRHNPSLATLLDEPRGSASSVLLGADRQPTIGISDSVQTLAGSLQAETGNRTMVFSIVGMGGAGKTTLAMEVCRRLEAEFPYQAMVSVSHAFEPTRDLEKLLNSILQQVVTPRMDCKGVKEEQAVRIDDLAHYLSHKRYIYIVLFVYLISNYVSVLLRLYTILFAAFATANNI